MKCDKESNIIYATRKYGLICGECERKMNDNKLKEKEEILKMNRKYELDV